MPFDWLNTWHLAINMKFILFAKHDNQQPLVSVWAQLSNNGHTIHRPLITSTDFLIHFHLSREVLGSHLCRNKIEIVSNEWKCNTVFHGWKTTPSLEKGLFLSCHERGTKKKLWVSRRNRTSNLWIRAPMLNHWAKGTLWWARPIKKFIYDKRPTYC